MTQFPILVKNIENSYNENLTPRVLIYVKTLHKSVLPHDTPTMQEFQTCYIVGNLGRRIFKWSKKTNDTFTLSNSNISWLRESRKGSVTQNLDTNVDEILGPPKTPEWLKSWDTESKEKRTCHPTRIVRTSAHQTTSESILDVYRDVPTVPFYTGSRQGKWIFFYTITVEVSSK